MRGLVPRWGRGGAEQDPPRRFAVPNHNSGPSEFVIAMKACPGLRSGIDSRPPFVIPAKAGIQEGWGGVRLPDDGKNRPVVPLSYLGVPAQAGMRDCYESMSRTPIRDRALRQPLIRHSRHPFVIPAPHSSFRRRPESRRSGEG